jgi:hypothetical protein
MVDPVEDSGLGLNPPTVATMVGRDRGGHLITTRLSADPAAPDSPPTAKEAAKQKLLMLAPPRKFGPDTQDLCNGFATESRTRCNRTATRQPPNRPEHPPEPSPPKGRKLRAVAPVRVPFADL